MISLLCSSSLLSPPLFSSLLCFLPPRDYSLLHHPRDQALLSDLPLPQCPQHVAKQSGCPLPQLLCISPFSLPYTRRLRLLPSADPLSLCWQTWYETASPPGSVPCVPAEAGKPTTFFVKNCYHSHPETSYQQRILSLKTHRCDVVGASILNALPVTNSACIPIL